MSRANDLLNGKQLAERLGRGVTYVTAMRRAGYQFMYQAVGKTTLKHALDALQKAPDFVAWHYLSKGWESMPKCLATKPRPAASTAGKSGSLLPNDQ